MPNPNTQLEVGEAPRDSHGVRRFYPYKYPANGDQTMRRLFDLLNEHRISRAVLSKRSGVCEKVIATWEKGRRGRIDLVASCYEAIGYVLTPTPVEPDDRD